MNRPKHTYHHGERSSYSRPSRYRQSIDFGDTRAESFGEWIYSHRAGLFVVIIAMLIGGITLATARYDVEIRPISYTIEFVEEAPSVEQIEKIKRERDRLQEEIERRMQNIEKVRNLQSNENAEVAGASQQMSYDSDMQQMMDKIASDMATNRNDYESGMREIDGIGKGGEGQGSGGKRGDGVKGKFSGAVTISYQFEQMKRNHRDLYVPAYKAKGGGIVVVDVWINRSGEVTSARINSTTNAELNDIALAAARNHRTLFDINSGAPTSHRGTITYTFVAQ